MQRLKNFLKRHRVTLMIIPSSEKSIKQVKFNLSIGFLALAVLSVFNIALFSTTLFKINQAKSLNNENGVLSENLIITTDRINALSNINTYHESHIEQLENTLTRSSTFIKAQLDEMEKTNTYVTELVTLFNIETDSSIKAPISRSYDRSNPTANPSKKTSDHFIDEIDTLIVEDEITGLIQTQNNEYEALIASIKSRLTYLDRRPDYYPTTGKFSSGFGYRTDPITGYSVMHNAIDISNKIGTPIYAAGAGVVTFAGYSGNFGNVVIIDHGNGYETVYAHCNSFEVNKGDTVEKAQLIAKIGRSGRTTGSHLHFELRYFGNPINPFKTLNTQ